MKKILVLVDSKSSSKKKLVRYLNANSKNKYKAFLYSFTDLYFDIKPGKVKIKVKSTDLSKFDLVCLEIFILMLLNNNISEWK